MKFILSNFFILLFFISSPVYAENFYIEFSIKVSGLKIGELVWELEIDNNNYTNDIKLKSKGLLSAIYTFEGNYFSKGKVANNKLKPYTYNHVWKTNKIEKTMVLSFENNTLSSLNQTPYEKEKLRIDVFNIKQTKDPLSSFLEIIMGENSSLVVDGRRTYTMNAEFNKKENKTVINISDYSNLWADHKRSKFEQISFEKKDGALLPIKINIHFDGRVFNIEQN
jgi:hypothetical protein